MASGVNSIRLVSSLFRKGLYFTSELYRPSVNRHQGKLIELVKEKANIASQSSLAKNLRVLKGFYTLEMAPPTTSEEISKLKTELILAKQFINTGCFKHLTVRQAWLLFLVVMEVGLWFFLGETIGKMHIVGYKV